MGYFDALQCKAEYIQSGYKPGKTWKPGILWEFSEPGKLMEFSGNSVQPQGKVITNEIISLNSCGWPIN